MLRVKIMLYVIPSWDALLWSRFASRGGFIQLHRFPTSLHHYLIKPSLTRYPLFFFIPRSLVLERWHLPSSHRSNMTVQFGNNRLGFYSMFVVHLSSVNANILTSSFTISSCSVPVVRYNRCAIVIVVQCAHDIVTLTGTVLGLMANFASIFLPNIHRMFSQPRFKRWTNHVLH